jgi:hypothetical protein
MEFIFTHDHNHYRSELRDYQAVRREITHRSARKIIGETRSIQVDIIEFEFIEDIKPILEAIRLSDETEELSIVLNNWSL